MKKILKFFGKFLVQRVLDLVFFVGLGFLFIKFGLDIVFGCTNINKVDITYYNIKEEKFDTSFRIVQISDLHDSEYGTKNKDLIDLIVKQNPDVILVTGDMLDSSRIDIETTYNFFISLDEAVSCPIIYERGNHETNLMTQYNILCKNLSEKKSSKFYILDDMAISLPIKDLNIAFMGIYKNLCYDADSLNLIYDTIPTEVDYTVVLSHFPEIFKKNLNNEKLYMGGTLNFDMNLIFSGHAHGGQFRWKNQGVYAPNQGYLPKWTSGVHNITDNEKLVISRGLGNSSFPIRINNRPELVVVDINGD